METEDEQQKKLADDLNESEESEQKEAVHSFAADELVIPDIPVVRTNTPRPFSFHVLTTQNGQPDVPPPAADLLAAFPREAPSAPPVPEEVSEQEVDERGDDVGGATPLPLAPSVVTADETAQEFIWLFEYGLEMDSAVLNKPERLHNLALLYGPAVLKGYQLAFAVVESQRESVIATILPSDIPGAEVWGIVYRIPRRLTEPLDDDTSQLDRAHDAVPPSALFERAQVTVYETYRGRELSCITYIAAPSAHSQTTRSPDMTLAQRLLDTIRKHQLPDDYVQSVLFSNDRKSNEQTGQTDVQAAPLPRVEQNTEPLPIVMDRPDTPLPDPAPQDGLTSVSNNRELLVFASYLVVILLGSLTLAVVQGLGIAGAVFTASFTPLSVPWYILVYGLIGGSINCLVTLGRQRVTHLPGYALIAWYMRPFMGSVLAMMVYLLLNSGLFASPGDAGQHVMLFSLLSSIAGYSEGWLFFRGVGKR